MKRAYVMAGTAVAVSIGITTLVSQDREPPAEDCAEMAERAGGEVAHAEPGFCAYSYRDESGKVRMGGVSTLDREASKEANRKAWASVRDGD